MTTTTLPPYAETDGDILPRYSSGIPETPPPFGDVEALEVIEITRPLPVVRQSTL